MKPGHVYKTPAHVRAYNKAHYAKHNGRKATWRDMGDLRQCTQCKEIKPRETHFHKLPGGRLGFKSECKTCSLKRQKGAAPSWTGLSREHYQKYVREGKCHICNQNKPRMAVDHCHTTQAKRGVLCLHCNRGLGMFFDNPEFLEAAAKYLRR